MSEDILRALSEPRGSGEGGADQTKPAQPTNHSRAECGDSLEGLLNTLKSQIKDSDWLKENTVERWEQENPELAAEFKKKMAEGNKSAASNS